MEKDQSCLWDVVHAPVHTVHSWAVLATVGVDLSEIHVNLSGVCTELVQS